MEHAMTTAKSLEVWSAQTICDIGILLSMISFLLHIGRPYFDRILGRITLRVGADLWWLAYIIARDGTLFLAVVAGFFSLNLDLMADIKIGLPFVPFGTVALAAALVVKVFRNAEDINRSFRLTIYLVSLGALLNTLGYVLVMEAPGDEYAAAKTAFWRAMVSLRSNENPALATFTFYAAAGMLVVLAIVATILAIRVYSRAEQAAQSQEASDVPA